MGELVEDMGEHILASKKKLKALNLRRGTLMAQARAAKQGHTSAAAVGVAQTSRIDAIENKIAALEAFNEVHAETSGAAALEEARIDAELRKLVRVDLLILDDFALQPMDGLDTADVYDLIVERHRVASTVVTSNREPIEWLGQMADPLLVDRQVGEVAGMRAVRIVETMLLVQRIVVSPCG